MYEISEDTNQSSKRTNKKELRKLEIAVSDRRIRRRKVIKHKKKYKTKLT